MPARKYDHDLIASMIRRGTPRRAIAEHIGCPISTVHQVATRFGLSNPRRTPSSPTQTAALYGPTHEAADADKAAVLADLERRGLADDLADMLGLRPAVSS
ncbi:hypothetical protein [Rathayibacter sp. AY2B5]|uniref:hypothetical protein n=1 Tax=Rathayibacter sp. AY2B5 TaxID=2080570 RepID=UPI000CE76C6D|nr:hypothetical protein [Rathayibacter sp. AY2B5]PPG38642.1 hypothetical protein C5C30_11735 [Rathayibacter sp. AY2B5]